MSNISKAQERIVKEFLAEDDRIFEDKGKEAEDEKIGKARETDKIYIRDLAVRHAGTEIIARIQAVAKDGKPAMLTFLGIEWPEEVVQYVFEKTDVPRAFLMGPKIGKGSKKLLFCWSAAAYNSSESCSSSLFISENDTSVMLESYEPVASFCNE